MIQTRLEPYGLTNIQYVVLEALWNKEGLSAVELGRALKIDKATLSGVLDRMTEAKWLIKKKDARDRRVLRLSPSGKANRLKEKLIEERKKANEELLSKFTQEERVVLKRLLVDLL